MSTGDNDSATLDFLSGYDKLALLLLLLIYIPASLGAIDPGIALVHMVTVIGLHQVLAD